MIVGSYPEEHMVQGSIYVLLAFFPLPSLIPITSHVKPISDGPNFTYVVNLDLVT